MISPKSLLGQIPFKKKHVYIKIIRLIARWLQAEWWYSNFSKGFWMLLSSLWKLLQHVITNTRHLPTGAANYIIPPHPGVLPQLKYWALFNFQSFLIFFLLSNSFQKNHLVKKIFDSLHFYPFINWVCCLVTFYILQWGKLWVCLICTITISKAC